MLRAPNNDPLDLARLGPAPLGTTRLSRAGIASIATHVVLFALFLAMPDTHFRFTAAPNVVIDRRQAVKLVAPRLRQELTQKDPNKGKVRNELDAFSAVKARPAPRAFQPPSPRGPEPQPAPQPPVIATPQIEVPVNLPQIAGVTVAPELPRSSPVPPKLDNLVPSKAPGTPNPSLLNKAPGDLTKAPPSKAGGPGGGIISDGDNGSSTALQGMQLLSDPKNVDFRPYMQAVAAKVRQQWARLSPSVGGTRTTLVVLHIDRQGRVSKVAMTRPSGIVPFDQAAIASISSAVPFAPLPTEYSDNEIQLQLSFTNYRVQ